MKKILYLLLTMKILWANDSEYGMVGNQLVPLKETSISIRKEVLTIKEVDSGLDVLVEYTFYNPNKSKKVMVGFEAPDVDEVYEEKPADANSNMESFTVKMNNEILPYKIKAIDVGYVYYFNATFKKGVNHLTHHYIYTPSGSVYTNYQIEYLLSPASRWAGGEIEDFKLIIDVGDFEDFVIEKSFFNSGKEWKIDGHTRETIFDEDEPDYSDDDSFLATHFYVKRSPVVFEKKHFKIKGELNLISWRTINNIGKPQFDYKKDTLPFTLRSFYDETFPADAFSYKIFQNLPYARRGYIFKNRKIQNYYKHLKWYKEDSSYKPIKSKLTQREKETLEKLNVIALKILKNLPYAKRGYIFKNEKLKYFFESQKWYHKNKNYIAIISALPKQEQMWIKKIKALKKSDNIDFYGLMDEYEKYFQIL